MGLLEGFIDFLQKVVAGPGGAYAAGVRYRDRGDLATAIGAFRQAEKQWRSSHPGDSAASLVQVAYCRGMLGDLTGARLDYEEVLRRVRANPRMKNMPAEEEVLENLRILGSENMGLG